MHIASAPRSALRPSIVFRLPLSFLAHVQLTLEAFARRHSDDAKWKMVHDEAREKDRTNGVYVFLDPLG